LFVFFFKDLMSNRGRRDKMKKKKEKREAPTLSSKAMFMFGKISTRIYEKRERERESKKMKLHTHTRTRKMRERESNPHCV